MSFKKNLKVAVKALDVKFNNMTLDEKDMIFRGGLIDMIEDVCEDVIGCVYEELTDWCIDYCKIKYSVKHPLNRFFGL